MGEWLVPSPPFVEAFHIGCFPESLWVRPGNHRIKRFGNAPVDLSLDTPFNTPTASEPPIGHVIIAGSMTLPAMHGA